MNIQQEQTHTEHPYKQFLRILVLQIKYQDAKKNLDKAKATPALAALEGHMSYVRGEVAKSQQDFATALADYVDPYLAKKEMLLAPGYQGGPNIPFVLFTPKVAATQKVPLIVHTHGGPHVAFTLNTLHAEIGYFIRQGYAVVCPNYRGSKFSEEDAINAAGTLTEELAKWSAYDEKLLFPLACDDVYAVAIHAKNLSFVDESRILLRGASFGSHINAHLLRECQAPFNRYQNIFCGAHLSGGVNYPPAHTLPIDLPLQVTHGTEDDIAPYKNITSFMTNLLLAQIYNESLAEQADRSTPVNMRTVCALVGDHHLVPSQEILTTQSAVAQRLLLQKISLDLGFVDNVFAGKYIAPDASEQLINLSNHKRISSETLLKLVRSFAYSKSLPSVSNKPQSPASSSSTRNTLCPTVAQLKLILGDQFTGDIANDFHLFLQKHFRPFDITQENKPRIEDAGEHILRNTELEQQLVSMITHEQEFLAEHPDYTVLYHAGTLDVLMCYAVITIWKAILRDELQQSWVNLPSMRFNDFVAKSFDTIRTFIKRMQLDRKADEKTATNSFNYTPGYQERMIACNPTLINNRHSSASCTLRWYSSDIPTTRIDCKKIIGDLLSEMGLAAPLRIERYENLFQFELAALLRDNVTQSVMQQIFVPRDKATEHVVVCQVWGEPFAENTIDLASMNTLAAMTDDPIAFEKMLREHQQAFTNPGGIPEFGLTNKDFHYSNMLEVRMRTSLLEHAVVKTYVRQPQRHQRFMHDLEQLVREDFAALLCGETLVADAQVARAEGASLRHRMKLGFYTKPQYNEDVLLQQQKQLRQKLVENPTKDTFKNILHGVPKAVKIRLQEKLGDARETCPETYLFSLCRYVKGYTYYELLVEAIAYAKAQHNPTSSIAILKLQQLAKLESFVDTYSVPSSMSNAPLEGSHYAAMKNLLDEVTSNYLPQPELHDFFQPKNGHYPAKYLLGHELRSAMESVMCYALVAKRLNYGYEVTREIHAQLDIQ